MESQIEQLPRQEKVQVYRNDFISGIITLTKKLFML